MKIFQAKKRVIRQRVVAVIIMTVTALLFVCAAMKSIYFAMDGDTTVFSSLSGACLRLIYFIYEHTQFVSLFWKWAPVVNPKEFNTSGNFSFLFIAICGAIGHIMWDSAASLAVRIKDTIKKIEELEWQQELMAQRGQLQEARPDVLQINIDLDQKDQWYKQPIGLLLIGVAIAVLGQWLNLQLGIVKL